MYDKAWHLSCFVQDAYIVLEEGGWWPKAEQMFRVEGWMRLWREDRDLGIWTASHLRRFSERTNVR